MSILLEALRKSEKSQRPVAPPTIHADEPGSDAAEPMSALLVALLIIAALLITAWLAWRQYQPVSDVYQPPVTLPAVSPAANPPLNRISEFQGKPAQVTTETQKPASVQTGESSMPEVKKIADESSGGKRTPVESYTPADTTSNNADSAVISKGNAGKKGSDTGAKTKAAQARASQKKGGKKGGEPVAANKSARKPDDGTTAPEAYQSPEPDPISYWELPDAIREQVPEIKFSVLVFADEPADRFVLMNGQRLGEGDSYQDGLVVKEIRRDGVVFSYRLYQFLIRR